MKVVCIVQARIGSTRLPAKILKKIEGKEMLFHVVERLLQCSLIDKIIVATTLSEKDSVVVDFVEGLGNLKVGCFRGSEEDVLDRYYNAAKENNAEVVVRITSDRPLIDPSVVDRVIQVFLDEPGCDYASSTIVKKTYPLGMEAEVLSFSALEFMWKNCHAKKEREHVTWHIVHNAEDFKTVPVFFDHDYSMHRWTVDEEDDLKLIREIYSRLYHKKQFFGMQDVLNLFEEDKSLFDINAHVRQKDLVLSKG